MTRARHSLIDLAATPYYHVISRCVRRAFLCGEDRYTGKNFDHRRQWLIDRVKLLSGVFSIDIAAYAIMSNHYHLVLRVDKDRALSWTMDEVIGRWYHLYHGHPIVDSYLKRDVLSKGALLKLASITKEWRERLFDISWLMRNLNEYIARAANKEDNCKGRYWEGRYKSQALLDETAILSCMMYVDLNPVRAGVSNNLIESDFTSIQERIKQVKRHHQSNQKNPESSILQQPPALLPFASSKARNAIHFSIKEYLELADWSGRAIHPNKPGFINHETPSLLTTLDIDVEFWLESVRNFTRQYGAFAGREQTLRASASSHNCRWHKGVG
ncbi:MAG: transposase [Gammaproteobacteria bacterium]|nr:transposase [Gammaproteobacteria bacterium]